MPAPAPHPNINTVVPELGSDPSWDQRDLGVLLSLTRGEDDAFYSPHSDANMHGALYGGQLVGQAMMAAAASNRGSAAIHCVQINFLTAGRPGVPMRYEVRQLMRGLNFSVQQVLGSQGDRTVVSANVSFHRGEPAPEFSQPLPADVPAPESLRSLRQVLIDHAELLPPLPAAVKDRLANSRSVELRPVDAERFLFERNRKQAHFRYWVRALQPLEDQPQALQQAALGYLSDYWFPLTALEPLVGTKLGTGLYIASLNHSVWFHKPANPNEWLFVDAQSPCTAGARGLSTATVYARDGQVVASLAQESLFRGWVGDAEGGFMAPGLSP
ncbi:MAG: thioesterase family protein [Paucibacter sp.]|nr:thioesterase family protein [Roseateles sp.]